MNFDYIYDYRGHETLMIKDYLVNHSTTESMNRLLNNDEDLKDEMREEMWMSDDITGNGSGSYTFSKFGAEENLLGNWDLLVEAINHFDDLDVVRRGPESCDVLIRLYLFDECLEKAMDEIRQELDHSKN